uniref:Nucleolar protein 16 n=1 Tax=Pavo cristatus TaxID=9049 RepID=A0A8C9ETQ3_PAVCR
MPKAKGKNRRQKFAYGLNRKRLYRSARRKAAPRIECSHIRHAWDATKSVAQNLAEMGLAGDPNKAVPIAKRRLQVSAESDGQEQEKMLVRKPYVLSEMEFEASLPEKKSNTLSRDLIDYVRYMIQNHGENYKVSTGSTSLPPVRGAWAGGPFTARSQRTEPSHQPRLFIRGRSNRIKGFTAETSWHVFPYPKCSPVSPVSFPGPSAVSWCSSLSSCRQGFLQLLRQGWNRQQSKQHTHIPCSGRSRGSRAGCLVPAFISAQQAFKYLKCSPCLGKGELCSAQVRGSCLWLCTRPAWAAGQHHVAWRVCQEGEPT